MSSSAETGFRRVTVVAPDSRIDVALPADLPAADIYPEILRLTGQTQQDNTPTGFHLVRGDGTALDATRTLAAQQVLDGELFNLRPLSQTPAPAVYDAVADAVASAVARDRRLWSDDLLRTASLIGGVLLILLMGFLLWFADPVRHDMSGLPGIVAGAAGVLLTAFAGIRARAYADRATSLAYGLGALPLLLIAGSGIVGPDAGQGPGRLQFLLGCVCVLIASVALLVLTPSGDSPFVTATFVSGAGTIATFVAILTDATATETAAGCVPVAIGLIAFFPALSARVARLPIGYAAPRSAADDLLPDPDSAPEITVVDADRIAVQARRSHELLLGLVGGCAAVVVGSAAVLGFSDNIWAQLLTLCSGIAMLLRARLFRYTSQVACALVAGIAAIALLVVGLSLNPPGDLLHEFLRYDDRTGLDVRTLWLFASLAAGAALLTAIGLIVPKQGLTPFWGRLVDLVESAVLLALLPLCLATLDLFNAARSLTS